jgi:hypothetical protein
MSLIFSNISLQCYLLLGSCYKEHQIQTNLAVEILPISTSVYNNIIRIVLVQNYEINQINVPNAIRTIAPTPPLLSCSSSN